MAAGPNEDPRSKDTAHSMDPVRDAGQQPPCRPNPGSASGGTVHAQSKAPRATTPRKPAATEAIVRVPSQRLDRLVNLVGELVMNQSRLTQVAAQANVPNLGGPVEELERLVAELRDNVLGIA